MVYRNPSLAIKHSQTSQPCISPGTFPQCSQPGQPAALMGWRAFFSFQRLVLSPPYIRND